jgi:ABC-type sugar transport system ATPase subunit
MGQQQKVIISAIADDVAGHPDMEEPNRGIDVGRV